MPTVYTTDDVTRTFLALVATHDRKLKVAVSKGGASEVIVSIGAFSLTRRRKLTYITKVALTVTRNGKRQRVPVSHTLSRGGDVTEEIRLEGLARRTAEVLAPLLKPSKQNRSVHVNAYKAKDFGAVVIANLEKAGYRTKLTTGFEDPDPKYAAYFTLPFVHTCPIAECAKATAVIAGHTVSSSRMKVVYDCDNDHDEKLERAATKALVAKLTSWFDEQVAFAG